MGCGISKSEFEETGQGYQIRSLRRRSTTNTNNIEEKDDESDSSTTRQRKSVSSTASDGWFLRRVLGSIERERVPERDVILDSSDNNVGLKSISSSSSSPPTNNDNNNDINNNNNNNDNDNNSFCFIKQPQSETMEKETAKENTINNKQVEKQEANDAAAEHIRPSNIEASILFGPGSPSFRVYCVRNDFISSTYDEDNDDDESQDIKSIKENEKGSDALPSAKRGRRVRGGFRNAMQMGGSAALGLRSVFVQRGASVLGRKSNIVMNGLCRSHNSTPSNEDISKLIPKAV